MNNRYVVGKIYGILKLNEIIKENGQSIAITTCILCGKVKKVRPYELLKDKQTSCRCQSIKHGEYKSKLYSVYHNMKDRCYNKNCHAYKDYGEKGVTICKEWLDDFINFKNWAYNNGYKEGLSIDRINVNGNYEPNNCRWITLSQNVAYANKTNHRRKADGGRYYGISPKGEYYEFDNANEFARQHNLNGGNIRDVANGRKKSHKKWTFGFIKNKE